jgi:hypothetical protein
MGHECGWLVDAFTRDKPGNWTGPGEIRRVTRRISFQQMLTGNKEAEATESRAFGIHLPRPTR